MKLKLYQIGLILIALGFALPVIGYTLPSPFSATIVNSGVPICTAHYSPIYAGTPTQITASISESLTGSPTPIVGVTLVFTITTQTEPYSTVATASLTSDGNGQAIWTWQNPIRGDYYLSVDWAGDSTHPNGGHTSQIPVTVSYPESQSAEMGISYPIPNDGGLQAGNSEPFTVQIGSVDGLTNIAGAVVTFKLDSNITGTATTDNLGRGTWTWASMTVGHHTLTTSWEGNAQFPSGASHSIGFTVGEKQAPTTTSYINWVNIAGAVIFAYFYFLKGKR
jgi:hypothetical protein